MLALFTLCAGAATVDGLKPLARAPMLSRRAFGAVGAAAPIAAALAPARAAAADAPPMPAEIPSARMPSWTMLIPIVELDDAVKAWSKRPDTVALDALCKGGLLSAKNFYLGVGTKYTQSIIYDDFDKKLIDQDKNARIGAIVVAGQALDAARKALQKEDAAGALLAFGDAGNRLRDFLARVPPSDIERARAAVAHVAAADTNKDNIIRDDEFYKAGALSVDEKIAATWGVWGTTLYAQDLRIAIGSPFILKIVTPPTMPDELKQLIALSEY